MGGAGAGGGAALAGDDGVRGGLARVDGDDSDGDADGDGDGGGNMIVTAKMMAKAAKKREREEAQLAREADLKAQQEKRDKREEVRTGV